VKLYYKKVDGYIRLCYFSKLRINKYMNALSAIPNFIINSLIYKEFIDERDEILKHKWLESEKSGYDIGFDKAIVDWIINHRNNWRKGRFFQNI
jgi:hypothetical protein